MRPLTGARAAFGMHHDIRPAFHTGANRHRGPCLGKTRAKS